MLTQSHAGYHGAHLTDKVTAVS